MFFGGIDIGSLTVDMVIVDGSEKIVAYNIIHTGANSRVAARKCFDETLEKAGITEGDLKFIVATGYGRVSVPFAGRAVTEITCHGRGAFRLFPETRTVIDIGGQDSKVIKLGGGGKVADFVMNDKCAAGTGRFLEVMARALEIELDEMGEMSLNSKNDIAISSMCTVFAESEVISLVAEATPKEDIINGIHNAICSRIVGMVDRLGKEEEVTITGGVAKNRGIVETLQKKLGAKLNVPDEPQIAGAIGAALIAKETAEKPRDPRLNRNYAKG
ncbi:MAG: acyl-CoA dehydratase activase [bacterium]